MSSNIACQGLTYNKVSAINQIGASFLQAARLYIEFRHGVDYSCVHLVSTGWTAVTCDIHRPCVQNQCGLPCNYFKASPANPETCQDLYVQRTKTIDTNAWTQRFCKVSFANFQFARVLLMMHVFSSMTCLHFDDRPGWILWALWIYVMLCHPPLRSSCRQLPPSTTQQLPHWPHLSSQRRSRQLSRPRQVTLSGSRLIERGAARAAIRGGERAKRTSLRVLEQLSRLHLAPVLRMMNPSWRYRALPFILPVLPS